MNNFFKNNIFSFKLFGQQNWQNILCNSPGGCDILTPNQDTIKRIRLFFQSFPLLLGAILILVMFFVSLYGGFTWISAGDNEEQIKKAKTIFKNVLIGVGMGFGLIIIIVIIGVMFFGTGGQLFNWELFNIIEG